MGTTDNFFEEQTEKSAIKSAIVKKFFSAYIRIISNGIRNRCKLIYYVDLFSGPGRYDNGDSSTPLHILEAISLYEKTGSSIEIQCIFNEENRGLYGKLKTNITDCISKKPIKREPIILNKNAIEVNLTNVFRQRVPIFSFIGPWGYKNTSSSIIWDLVRNIGSDCVFFFNANRIYMDLFKQNQQSDMQLIFGAEYNNLISAIHTGRSHHEKIRLILYFFSRNLQSLAAATGSYYKLFILPFGFKFDDRERDSHYLLFITKNYKAVTVMKDVMSQFATAITDEFGFDSKKVDQIKLFSEEESVDMEIQSFINSDIIKPKIIRYEWTITSFLETIDSLAMIHKSKVTPFSIKDMRCYLRKLYDNGLLVTTPPISGREKFKDDRVFKLRLD